MSLLAAGLVLFIGTHLLPTVPSARNALYGRLGENGYKGLFSLLSLAGLGLIVAGYPAVPDRVPLFPGLSAAAALAPAVMVVSFILFAAANFRCHIRQRLQHPQLLGLLLWSGVHLLACGERAATLMFGAFFAWGVVDLVSSIRRHAVKSFVPEAKFDVMVVVGGALAALAVMAFHRQLFGVAVVPWAF